jgi:hypothetical protein
MSLENTNTGCTPKTANPIESQFNMLSNSTNELRNLWEDLKARLASVLTPIEVAPPENKKAPQDVVLPNISSLANNLCCLRHTIDALRTDMNETFGKIEL